MFPHENNCNLRMVTTSKLNRFLSCNSDNRVETVLIIGHTFMLWETHVVNVLIR